MAFINGLTILLVYQLIGELCVKILQLPIPGPVMGMALLFLTLVLKKSLLPVLEKPATQLLSHLSLLFVPAGVGVMVYAHQLANQWFPIVMTLVFGMWITMASVALSMQFCLKFLSRRN
ncbi:MAG: holin-like protein [Cellvibrionaceae bacterium]|jgi:holin-like protein